MFRGKNYKESAKLIDKQAQYEPQEAFELITKTAKAKFDETVELHVKLGVDSRHADQQVRGAIVLPHGTGKVTRVLVFCKEEQVQEALDAGADYAGGQDLVAKIQGENWFEFDTVIASPNYETIRLDFNLPKYSVIEQKDPNPSVMSYDFLKQYMESNDKEGVAEFNLTVSPTMLDSVKTNQEHKQVRTSLLGINHKENSWFKKIKDYVDEYRRSKFDVIHFFSEVKIQTENEMKQYRDRIKDYILMLGYAERSGQYALKEKLFRNMVICKYESILFSKGLYKAISEENLMKFAKGCPKNLCLDYISDYTRIIPFDIIRKKTDKDKYEIFDNYVILHYDFDNNGTDLPSDKKKEEMKKRKDPILFGVIAGSNKLYFIGDWIDEYCDLRFDDVVKQCTDDFLSENISLDDLTK